MPAMMLHASHLSLLPPCSMALAVSPQSAGHTLLAVDGGAFWRLFSIVETPAAVALNINFGAWGVAHGALITAEEVSAVSLPEGRQPIATGVPCLPVTDAT
jgi:hypothetical protein